MTSSNLQNEKPGSSASTLETEKDSDSIKIRASFADQLSLAALALFILFISAIANSLIPAALFNPAWQIRLTATLISNGFLPLLALALFQLGFTLKPLRRSETIRKKLCSFAVLASLGFLLLIPLQGWASWRLIRENFQSLEKGKPPADLPLQEMEKAIKTAPDAQTLQANLTILRGPAIAPQDMARPLPELKQMLLGSLEQARSNLLKKAGRDGADPRVWVLIQDNIRLSFASLGLAIAFAAFAQRPGQSKTLLKELSETLGLERSLDNKTNHRNKSKSSSGSRRVRVRS
jgi:hypothetical protein